MKSIFYQAKFERRFNVTLLLLERIAEVFNADREDLSSLTQKDVDTLLRQCLHDCGVAKHFSSVDKRDLEYLMQRLQAILEEAKSSQDAPSPSKKKAFASSYADWAGKLQTDHICLLAAGFDYFKAKRMYMELDKDDVTEIAKRFLEREWEKIKIGYESVVYGFGGSYEGDNQSSGGNTVDMSGGQADESAMAQLKKMGF